MGRIHRVLLITPDVARLKAYYENELGLAPAAASAGAVFPTRGATLALESGAAATIEIAIDVGSLDERLTHLRARGAQIVSDAHDEQWGRLASVRDPDGNVVRLVQLKHSDAGAKWPRLSHVFINTKRFTDAVHFYRDALGLRVRDEHETWLEFDTGDTTLALHDREDDATIALHESQQVAIAFEDDDLDAWAEELRERGVHFAAAPAEQDLGLLAEVEDPDGWFVVLHGPPPETPIEDELAAEYEDDDEPRNTQIRRAGDPAPGEAPRRRTLTPAKLARKNAEKAGTKSFETMQREPERFPPGRPGDLRPSAPPRPGGFSGPRPGGFSGPRPGGFSGPRPSGPGGPRPSGPRPNFGPGGPPRPPGSGPRPGGPSGPRGPRPGGPPRDER